MNIKFTHRCNTGRNESALFDNADYRSGNERDRSEASIMNQSVLKELIVALHAIFCFQNRHFCSVDDCSCF
jgi:hypothetical protein